MNDGRKPEVVVLEKPYAGLPTGARLLIPTPGLVQAYVQKIPRGVTVPVPALRDDLAREFDAAGTCPLTVGIFLRIVAEAACELLKDGAQTAEVTPFWRAIDPKSPLAGKVTCGAAFIESQRASEQ